MYESMVKRFQHYYIISETFKICITAIFFSGKEYSNKVIPTEFNMNLMMGGQSSKKYNFFGIKIKESYLIQKKKDDPKNFLKLTWISGKKFLNDFLLKPYRFEKIIYGFWGGGRVHLSQYYDSLFSSIGPLCGGILFFQGWRLDPILLLSQILLSGTTVFFIVENLYLRNSSHYSKYVKRIGGNSRVVERYTYKNFKLKKSFSIDKNRIKKISYTKYLSYRKREQGRKVLNYL